MKKIISMFLAVMMLGSLSASAKDYPVWENPREIPADVYQTPYAPNQFVTVYAPWLKNFHMTSAAQIARGEYGGEACQQIRAMAISPLDSNLIYYMSNTSGIYKTTDGGQHSYNVTGNMAGHDGKGLLCDIFDKDIVYAAMSKVGVHRSKDGGKTWEQLLPDDDNKASQHRSHMMDMDASGNLYMGVNTGLYKLDRKTDEVTSYFAGHEEFDYITKLSSRNGVYWWDVDVSPDGQHIYACMKEDVNLDGTVDGIYTSHDGGKTWEILITDETHEFGAMSLAIHPDNPLEIYFSGVKVNKETGKTDRTCALYKSTDGGKTYEELYQHIYKNAEEGTEPTVCNFYSMKFGPKNSQGIYPLYYSATNSTYPIRASYDYGKTFPEYIYEPEDALGRDTSRYGAEGKTYTGWLQQSFEPDMNNPGRVIFGSAGLCEYRDGREFPLEGEYNGFGKSWTISSGYSGAGILSGVMDSKGNLFLCTMDVGAYYTETGTFGTDKYPTMKSFEGGARAAYKDRFALAVFDPNDDNHMLAYVGNSNGTPPFFGIRQSYDGGASFEPIHEDTKMEKGTPTYGNTFMLQYDSDDKNTIYTTYHTSHDNGKTWTANEMLLAAVSTKDSRYQLGIKGTGADTEFHYSDDRGATWKLVCKPGQSDFTSASIDLNDPAKVWVVRKRLFGQLDVKTGVITSYNSNFKYTAFSEFTQNPNNPDHMFVTSSPGALQGSMMYDFKLGESRDGGKTWHTVPGFWGSTVNVCGFSTTTPEVFVGTMGGLMLYNYEEYWKYLDSKITVVLDGKEVSFDEQPVIVNGRVMVPMRGLFEALGATVTYDAATRSIKAVKDGKYIILTIGSDKATINGQEVTLDSAPYITSKSRTMVPIRFASEALELGVGWSQASRKVIINS